MTFNIENGGTQVNFNSVVEAIKKSHADVVGIQEAWGNTAKLAKSLGWKYFDPRQQIISRYPLLEPIDSNGEYLFIEVIPGKVVAMTNMHLPDAPYSADLIKAGSTIADVEANERKVRIPSASAFIKKIIALAEQGMPVFLTGDFNSPSLDDWTPLTVGKLPHHRYAVVWPVTQLIHEKGLIDSFRKIYPDPIKDPGYTWPAGRPFVTNSYDNFNPSKTNWSDRIDFIFTGGQSHTTESYLVGEPNNINVHIPIDPWPSDHRAVVSRFEVTPTRPPVKSHVPLSSSIDNNVKPTVSVPVDVISSGKPFTVSWHNAPGNRYDFIQITPLGTKKLGFGEAVRLYTHGKINGSVQYNAINQKGNFLAWCKSEKNHWPLTPGIYDIKLMLDDGNVVIAATQIKVQ